MLDILIISLLLYSLQLCYIIKDFLLLYYFILNHHDNVIAIAQSGVPLHKIQKLVVVSSTGFLGPSLDCELIKSLNLPRSTDRSLVGFMGCAAAMNGYRIAMDFVKSHPGEYALMVCVEISSIHTTFKDSINDCILHAIFADGASACVLSHEPIENIPKGM